MLSNLAMRHWISLHGVATVVAIAVFLISTHTFKQRRHPSASIAWVVSLILLPYAALPLYLLVGNRKLVRPMRRVSQPPAVGGEAMLAPYGSSKLSQTLALARALDLPVPSHYTQFTLHADGQASLAALRSGMANAKLSLDVSTFVFGRDVLGREVSRLLCEAASRGVTVRLMVDGVGRYLGGFPRLGALRQAGVQVAIFVPPWEAPLSGRSNLRNHRKMVIADGQWLWMGGRNLAAEYFVGDAHTRPVTAAWLDLTFALSGAVATQAHHQFNQDWCVATRSALATHPLPASFALTDASAPSTAKVQLIPSGPDQTDDTVYALLISSCYTAHRRILAVSPYFVPDATLQTALTLAARRGVQVDVLLPEKSNHRMADVARRAAMEALVDAGARIWLLPQMIHAKAVVVDDDLALVGTANLDERSLFLNYEIMVAFYARHDVAQFAQWIEKHRRHARQFEARPVTAWRQLQEGLVRWVGFQL